MKNIYGFKLGFRYDGHGVEAFEFSTKDKVVGDIVYLPHSFFFLDGLTANLADGSSLSISSSDPNSDILVINPDGFLSSYTKKIVYSAIKLNKSRVCNTTININCNFVGDTIDPNDFGQMLNPESDVKHKTVETSDKIYTPNLEADQITTQSISGQFGVINSEDIILESKRVVINNVLSFDKDKMVTSSPSFYVGTESIGLQLDNTSSTFSVVTPETTSKVVTYLVPDNEANSIPIISMVNPEKLETVPWLKVGNDYDVWVPKIVTNDISCQSIKIGKVEIKYDTNILYIGNSIKINTTTEEVQIGNVVFDTNLLDTLSTLVKDIQDLKKKL